MRNISVKSVPGLRDFIQQYEIPEKYHDQLIQCWEFSRGSRNWSVDDWVAVWSVVQEYITEDENEDMGND